MSVYNDINWNFYPTPTCLHLSTLHYILEKIQKTPELTTMIQFRHGLVKGNGEALLQLMFDKSPINMIMYGSAKELAENVKIFKNFPGSDRCFCAILEPYFSTPIIYRNLKNEKFICKSDLFVMLQSMVLQSFDEMESQLTISMIAYFLKSKERLNNTIQFVPFGQKVFDEILVEVQQLERVSEIRLANNRTFEDLQDELSKLNCDQLYEKLKSFVPNTWDADESGRIFELLQQFTEFSSQNFDFNTFKCAKGFIFAETRIIVEGLQEIINKRPGLFKNQTQTVRVFEDGDQKFVMKAELFNALKLTHDYDSFIETIPFEKVLREFEVENFEFIRYPIQRTKHRAVPIPVVHTAEDRKNFCILAVDALFEHLRSLIFGHQLFQKFQNTYWKPIQVLFDSMERYFNPDFTDPYFLGLDRIDTLENTLKIKLDFAKMISAKTIRNAKSDGFTMQNLKNELKYLGLTVTFPEIQDHAEVVYAHVDKIKKEKYLRTCDLYDAVKYCQLICIFERLPNYKKFLHNQGGCGRVPGLNCELCDEKKKNDEDQKGALQLEGLEINSQTSVKAVTFSDSSDSKPSEVLKVMDSNMEASDSHLTELNAKIASLEAQLSSQSEKSSQLESDLLKATQKNELLYLEHIKLQSENEVNKGVMCQLIDKLSINQESPRSIPIVTSSTSLIECIICHIDIFNTQNTIKCPNCRTRFHKKCALNYSKDHKECPSCKGTIQESAICLN